jgi:DNA processing protein
MVQAMNERSGALITVRQAVEQGREVFAVPGNAGSRGGRMGNRLIKDGAHLVETADDVVLHLRPLGAVDLEREAPRAAVRESGSALGDAQARVYALVPAPAEGAIEVADLVRQCGAPVAEVQGTLLELELAGLVRPLPGTKSVRLIEGQ